MGSRLVIVAHSMGGVRARLSCVDEGPRTRRLRPADVTALGGDAALAGDSFDRHGRVAGLVPVGHVQVVGAHQPTPQSLTIVDGVATGHTHTCRPDEAGGIERVDLAGDGTVYPGRRPLGLHARALCPIQLAAVAQPSRVTLLGFERIHNPLCDQRRHADLSPLGAQRGKIKV